MQPRQLLARTVFFIAILGAFVIPVSCDPHQTAVLQSIMISRRSMTCTQAVADVFPATAQPEMQRIVQRESGGDASAQNKHSSASGCLQLTRVHAPLFTQLGFSWSRDRYTAYPNITVAYALWRQAGLSPWRATR